MHKLPFICFNLPCITEANKWNKGKTVFDDIHDNMWIEGFFQFSVHYAAPSMQDSSTSGTMSHHQDSFIPTPTDKRDRFYCTEGNSNYQ